LLGAGGPIHDAVTTSDVSGVASPDTVQVTASGPDRGVTLIEIVLAIVLLGVVAIPVLGAVRGSIMASSTSKSAAKVETALLTAADNVNRAPMGCDYAPQVTAAAQRMGWDPTRATVVVQYLAPGGDPSSDAAWTSGPAATPGCPAGGLTSRTVQRVTVTMTSGDGKIRRTIELVKSGV
jgi:prepilin-type N-terminal cleavage/methylation domain-containing protein